MSFIDEVVASSSRAGSRCGLPALLADLEPDVADEVRTAIGDPRYQVPAIIRAATARGIDLSKNLVERHRHGQCKSCRS